MKLAITDQSIIQVAEEQVSSDSVGESIILNLTSGKYYGLDEVGARIWGLIQQPIKFSDIFKAILAEYRVEPTRCQQDLLALLYDLAQEELIIIRNEMN